MTEGYHRIKQRLDEILEAVQDSDISLDEALSYYEEAVNLGLAASRALDDPADEQEADAFEESGQGVSSSLEEKDDASVSEPLASSRNEA